MHPLPSTPWYSPWEVGLFSLGLFAVMCLCFIIAMLGISSWIGERRYSKEKMRQYFYQQATPNDYFIGVLSGPGYMYPKAIPNDKRPALIEEARKLTDNDVITLAGVKMGFFET